MNIVVIVTDSLRTDYIGCYDSEVKTPNIDRLAKEGVKLTQAYSENLPTLPTRRAWWTGKYHFHEAGWQPFTAEDYLLAEILWDKGYKSALITDTYHMHKPVYNCGRGFDTTVFVRGQEYDPWVVGEPADALTVDESPYHRLKGETGEERESDELWRERYNQYLRNRSRFEEEEDYPVARVARETNRWLEQIGDGKGKDDFFLWVDMFDPHEPWDPPEPYRSMYKEADYDGPDLIDPVPGSVEGYMTEEEVENTKNLYAGEVTFVDKYVGKILDKLDELDLAEETLVMHTSDHGEPFGEHGYIRKARPRNYQNLVHIPWTIRFPDGRWAGRECGGLVQSVDLTPTLLDLLGVESEELTLEFTEPDQSGKAENIFPQDLVTRSQKQVLGGRSLMPLLAGEVERIRDFAPGGHYNREWYARTERWSYLLPLDEGREAELYDRRDDPEEKRNVIEENPEVAKGLELSLYRFVQSLRGDR